MADFKNIQGQKFGYLTALFVDSSRKSDHTYWICQCDCGKTRSLQLHQLTSGKVTSCGCHNHGRVHISQEQKRIYNVYSSMIARCYNPKSISYKYYGNKGIYVCDEWKNSFQCFVQWAFSNGYNDSLSIDRIDNSRGYEPSNCRWIPLSSQQENRTNNVCYTHNNETHTQTEWCRILNFSPVLAKSRRKEAKKKGIEPTFEYVFAPSKHHRTKSFK